MEVAERIILNQNVFVSRTVTKIRMNEIYLQYSFHYWRKRTGEKLLSCTHKNKNLITVPRPGKENEKLVSRSY